MIIIRFRRSRISCDQDAIEEALLDGEIPSGSEDERLDSENEISDIEDAGTANDYVPSDSEIESGEEIETDDSEPQAAAPPAKTKKK